MGKRRIFWSVEERRSIIKKSVEILREFPDLPIFRAVGEAQQAVLPASRRRDWITKPALGSLVKQIETELNKPVPNRIKPIADNPPTSDIVAMAHDFATRKEIEMLQRATASGVQPPSFEFLLVLWSSNFRAYLEAKHDKL